VVVPRKGSINELLFVFNGLALCLAFPDCDGSDKSSLKKQIVPETSIDPEEAACLVASRVINTTLKKYAPPNYPPSVAP